MESTTETEKTVVLNPVSGTGDHAEAVRNRAILTGFDVVETEGEGDAVTLAREAAEDGAELVAAAGGDGTLNEVIQGVDAADALDDTTVGVIPVGTGNNFAQNIGVNSIEEAFDVLQNGPRRDIDLGGADDRLFVNSCISGLTAEASGETDPEMKSRLGVVAYIVNTFETVSDFDGLRLSVDIWHGDQRDPAWTGDAIIVLVGNGRRFSLQGRTQANMEDGLFDVTIVENAPTTDLVENALLNRLFGKEAPETVRLQASSLELVNQDGNPVSFSLDGEIVEATDITLEVCESALTIPVGDDYEPDPPYDDVSAPE